MEFSTSHPLPDVGSFSYSWPTSKPEPRSEERTGHGDIPGFIERAPASASQCSFDFRPSLPLHTEAMADADQMFLDGLLLPLHLASQRGHDDGDPGHEGPVLTRSLSLDSSQRMMIPSAAASRRHQLARPASQNSSPCGVRRGPATIAASGAAVFRTSKLRLPTFGRCRKQHKWIPFRFLVPLYRKMVRCIWRRKAMDGSHRAGYAGAKVKLNDLGQENAVKDAILHCKRSL